MNLRIIFSLVLGHYLLCSASADSSCINSNSKIILYLPLDERFTTRDAFLNLAKVTPYCVMTPDLDLLPSLKNEAKLNEIHEWVDENIASADVAILSAEMYLYGGLISSRVSNESTSVILERADRLSSFRAFYPSLDIYVSNVVMRIPSYNGDFEEPWYWADYGYDLYTYSFYMDKFDQLGEPMDLAKAATAVAQVPESAVEEFLWRRQRNHNVTMFFLNKMGNNDNGQSPFNYFYTTLDDNAEYGFNIREAEEIKTAISGFSDSITNSCPVYPGADEVHLTMLARFDEIAIRHFASLYLWLFNVCSPIVTGIAGRLRV